MIKEYTKNALKSIKRNKKNLILISIFSLLLILLIIDIIFIKNFNDYFDYAFNKNIGFRTFTVYHEKKPTESTEEIKKIQHVTEVYGASYKTLSVKTNFNSSLDGRIELLYGTKNTAPKSLVGKSIEEIKSGEMICPLKFYPDSSIGNLKIEEKKIVNKEQSLNQEFQVFYLLSIRKIIENKFVEETKELTKDFKIVGLYDSALVMNFNNQCYITPKDMIELQDSLNPPLDESHSFSFLHVVVDENKNVKETMNVLQNLGYIVDAETNATIDYELEKNLKILSIVLFLIVSIATFFLLVNYLNKKVRNEVKYLGILRACGYNKLQVIIKELIENNVLFLTSFLISICVVSILFRIIETNFLQIFSYLGYKMTIPISFLFVLFCLITLIFSLIQIIIIRKNIEKPISILLKEE